MTRCTSKSFAAAALAVAVAVFIMLPGCRPDADEATRVQPVPPKPAPATDSVTVFLTGNVLSTLKPCGCSEDQLGGLARRRPILDAVEPQRRFIADTGDLLREDGPQDRIKLSILFQAMQMLGYDAVRLNAKDLTVAADLGLLQDPGFALISDADDLIAADLPARVTKRLPLGDSQLAVTLAALRTKETGIAALPELLTRPDNAADLSLNILILDTLDEQYIGPIADSGLVDVLVLPAAANEPRVLGEGPARPLTISVGRLGEYITRLTVTRGRDGSLDIAFADAAVSEELPPSPELDQLYELYKQIVKEEDLLNRIDRVPLPDGLKYMGSDSCKTCHKYEHGMWSTKAHAHAYQTLVEVGSQYDPECIKCHVVGFGYESGFHNETSPKDLRDVGCENCHGPGSEHIQSVMNGKYVPPGTPKARCTDCHTPEQSVHYDPVEYMKKIVHWREPKDD